MPSRGPELYPISTVQTQSQSTTVPAPVGLQSPFPNRGVQRDGGGGKREQWQNVGYCDRQRWFSGKNHQFFNA